MKNNKIYNWISKKISKLWEYIYQSVVSGKAVAASFACLSWLLVIALLASFFITPKPWYVQFALTIVGMFTGGTVGGIVGFVLGGIGFAVGGTAVGVAGWLVGTIFGATVGGFFGLLASFISNPAAYSFSILKFCLVATLAFVVAYFVYKVVNLVYSKVKSWLSRKFGRQGAEPT